MSVYKLIFILFVCAVFVSCETTKLVYKPKTVVDINRLGLASLNKKSPKLDSLFPKLDSTFTASAIKYSNRFLAKETLPLEEKLSCHQPDSLLINQLCIQNNLDGIILTYVEFRLMIHQIYYIPTSKYYECILYSKIYDKTGMQLYSVIHDSKNDTYENIPNTYDVVNLATGISYKKIYTSRQK